MMVKLNESGLRLIKEFRARTQANTQNMPGHSTEILERSMLSQLIAGGMSDTEISATMINTLLAASEGPASALTTTLFELSLDQPAQSRLANEVAGNELPDYENLMNLDFLSQVVMEGLRLNAPVTLVQRQATEDVVLDGFEIKAGTLCAVCIAAVHHDPKQFQGCTRFDAARPEAMDVGTLKRDHCFMPFSGGPRGCPGKHLAVTILRVATARIVQKYDLKPAARPYGASDSKGVCYKFVEWPVGGLFVDL